nr:hypothetical protein HmN_000430400 [Hymenolepis microstoma]
MFELIMAVNGTTLGPNKAHRVSRHVSFQAVVPPAVSFPVNYTGPSLMQANNHTSSARQSITELHNLDSSPEEFKRHAGRQMSTVISLDHNKESVGVSNSNSNSPFDKLRTKFTFLNTPKKKNCFLESLQFVSKQFTLSKRKCLSITSALIFCIVLVLIITAVSITASHKYSNKSLRGKISAHTSEVCENPACLRIGLFFQTALFEINERGIEDPCSNSTPKKLVKLMWDGEAITFQSPFSTPVEEILRENLKENSGFPICISNTSKSTYAQKSDGFVEKAKSIVKLLHDVTLIYNSFDEVLHIVHIQYKIALFFEIRTEGTEIEISTPTIIQPWHNFNLRHIHSRFAHELRRYICCILNYAQLIGIISNVNSTENCDYYDSDRVNAVYEILQILQEVNMLMEVQKTRLKGNNCSSMTLFELNTLAQNTVCLGSTSPALCVSQPQFEQQVLREKSNELKAFIKIKIDEVFTLIKKAYENYFKESPPAAALVSLSPL